MRHLLYFILLLPLIVLGKPSQKNNLIHQDYITAARTFKVNANNDSAKIYYEKAIAEALNKPDSSEIGQWYYELGKIHENTGAYSDAQDAYNKGIKASQADSVIGLCKMGLSNVNFRIANNTLALKYGIEAAQIFSNLKDTSNYIDALNLIGQVYISMQTYMDALDTYNKTLKLATDISDSADIAYTLDHIATIFSFTGEYSKAIDYYKQSYELNLLLKNKFYMSINLANIGEQYLRLGNYKKALEHLNESEDLAVSLEFNSLLINLFYVRGEIFSRLNKNAQALDQFQKSLATINTLGELREKPYVYKLLSEHYYRHQQYKKAFDNQKIFKELSDSLKVAETNVQIEELRARYEIERREQEYKSLLLTSQIKDQELNANEYLIKVQMLIILLVILGLISSTAFTIYFFRSQRKLKATNKTKDVLFSIIGHDLKSPMGNIKQIVELLLNPDTSADDRDKYQHMLKQPVNSAFALLEDLLAWSGSINNKLIYKPEEINIYPIIENSFALIQSLANAKNISLLNQIPDVLEVYADKNHVSTIFRNLISNAVKFTSKNGSVTISYEFFNGEVNFFVTDTGIGIEPQQIKKILDSSVFYTTFGTNNEKGSGLGLILCQEFIKKNGGTFSIESSPGQGTTISFTLPIIKNKLSNKGLS